MMPASAPMAEDRAYQDRILQGVSRTFALTIPVLPLGLCEVVGNAYLLCRIADTVEDDAGLSAARQRDFSERFVRVVEGTECAERFSGDLHPLLAPDALDAERNLILNVPKVIRITHGFNANQRRALARCVRIMAKGMADYQMRESLDGLPDLPAMDEYCYFVAGVVGEMLTELFCDYSAEIAAHRDRLMPLAVSFGQGLQMTNILKDIWEDRRHGACWLPRDLFLAKGVRLRDLEPGRDDPGFFEGLSELIGIARRHLDDALSYTLLIPVRDTGIRRFCLWAIGMAILTLRKISRHRDFTTGREVKISRRSVWATVAVGNALVRHDGLLRLAAQLASKGLPINHFHDKLTKGGADRLPARGA
ncbi:MAG: phytoene/squalene synthase family protein [Pseudomonadota bacterium]|nr:phytoene/squalene synthase family protein [Pseudomonadota bacterium]